MTNKTFELKPEARKGLECITRNKSFLESQGVLNDDRHITDIVYNFYNLGIFGGFLNNNKRELRLLPSDDTKIGKTPEGLIGFLEDFNGKPIASSTELLKYENVRESLNYPLPKNHDLWIIAGFSGGIISFVGPITAAILNKDYGMENIPAVCYGLASFVGGCALFGGSIKKSEREEDMASRIHSERTGESLFAYGQLIKSASNADAMVNHYRDLFIERQIEEVK